MRLLIIEHFRTAVESLRRTRTRTGLTILGIGIGIASITSILALSSGISNILRTQTEALGDQIALIRPAAKQTTLTDISNPAPTTSFTTSPLTEEDLEAVQKIPGVEAAVPLMTLSGSIYSSSDRPATSTILATTPEFIDTSPLAIDSGDFLGEEMRSNTVVLGQQLAINLFGTNGAIGKTLTIIGQTFTCIGVLKRQNNPVNYNVIDFDNTAIIRFDSGKLFNKNIAQIQQINIKVADGVNMGKLKNEITNTLVKNHDGAHDSTVLVGSDVTTPVSQQFSIIQIIMAFIAGISLLVGGVGIMNIMLVSVAERTREIGLRKAVGATSTSIITQFMIEALITSLLGGLLGYLSGYALAYALGIFLPYNPAITIETALTALGLSLGVGVVFGIYPAIRAAQKNPIESLRRLH